MSVRKNLRNLLAHVANEDYDAASREFEAAFERKAANRMEIVRKEVAQNMFGKKVG